MPTCRPAGVAARLAPVASLVAFAGWALAACAGAPEREVSRTASEPPASPMVALDHAEFGEQDAGKPVWKAIAGRATFRVTRQATDAKVVDLADVEARFFEDGKPVTRGKAPDAVWRQSERDLLLAGGVTLEALGDRAGVAAREARWDPRAGRLLATGGVRFWQGANQLTAASLQADRGLRRVELTGGVLGKIALGAGTPALFARSGREGRAR